MTTEDLVKKIRGLSQKKEKLIIIAISGFCGSGKSTLANKLSTGLGDAEVISIDDFIIGRKDERSDDWHTFDRKRLRKEILVPARPDKQISYRQYNSGEWVENRGGMLRTITPHKYLIIEGCGIIHPELISYYDISVWIDCQAPEAWRRAKDRDMSQGNDDRKLWDEVWEKNDMDFFNNFHPDKLASLVIEQ